MSPSITIRMRPWVRAFTCLTKYVASGSTESGLCMRSVSCRDSPTPAFVCEEPPEQPPAVSATGTATAAKRIERRRLLATGMQATLRRAPVRFNSADPRAGGRKIG